MLTGLTMFKQCIHLGDILKAQIEIIGRHIDEHKWFQGITDKEKAISDFIQKYEVLK
jgi:hypothetical protein